MITSTLLLHEHTTERFTNNCFIHCWKKPSYFGTVSKRITLQMNSLGTPQHKNSNITSRSTSETVALLQATYSSTTTIILPFVDNFTASSTELCDSSPSPSRHSPLAAPDKFPLLVYKPQRGLSLCWWFPRRVPQRTASILVALL